MLISANSLSASKFQRRRHDCRTRAARNASLFASWNADLPDLVVAYLQWKHGSTVSSSSECDHVFQVARIGLRGESF